MLDLCKYRYHQEPFEYYESTESFSTDIYNMLHETFPTLENILEDIDDPRIVSFTKEKNRIDINLAIIENLSLHQSWLNLIKETTSLDFFHDLCNKFNLDKSKYKTISNRHEKLNTDIEVDFQFAYNVKSTFKKTQFLRQPHVDSPNKIFVILMYFPEKNDIEYNSENDFGYLRLYKGTEKFFKSCGKIDYNHNHSIIFKNSVNAVHAPYSLINHPTENRRFLNIIFSDKRIV
tara:strand:- start:1819 stop:2517 length:699 start_codon:yes stop_codon:yes gene_type:complete